LERMDESADWLVIGADQLPLSAPDLLDPASRQSAEQGRLTILSETEFWKRLGLLDDEETVQRLYTPAMLAELLRIPLATIRRWHRRGLIVPAREVHRLPYFDYQEISTARQLANLLAAGMSPAAIEQKLASLARFVRGIDRSLNQLAVIVEGRQILLRQGEGLVEPSGQRRFDFDPSHDDEFGDDPHEDRGGHLRSANPTISLVNFLAEDSGQVSVSEILEAAAEHEERGQLAQAAELCRAAMAAEGPRAEICFQLAELLYRLGDVAGARERYFMAIELNEDFVEARASLGCVLAESGELDLAVAAFQGALLHHPNYADVHYHLARTLGELGHDDAAREHWRTFLTLTPDSPWAEEARIWLGVSSQE
jgi:tetratricopeptide (TPR) repeat protein